MEAPSSWNHQARSVVVVDDPHVKEDLLLATGGQAVVAAAPISLVFVAELDDPSPDAEGSQSNGQAVAREAWSRRYSPGSAEAAARFQQGLKERGLLREYAVKDAMIAASFAMLAAQGEGLATAPMNGWDEAQVKKVLGINDRPDLVIALVMALGHAEHVPQHPGRASHEHIFDNAYGRPVEDPAHDEGQARD